ncbi:MAG: bacterial transcriptional activator domain-containing protein, partial [Burkholderiales bacterium]|nr:bacterial transcriptional activator domain-containing protein [Burkholderiales bacterium]
EQAQMLYLRGIDADPIVEVFHQGLMRCYQAQGRHLEAISAFRRMRQILSVVLGVAPSPESVRLYEVSAHVSRGDATDEPSDKVIPLPKRTRNSLR